MSEGKYKFTFTPAPDMLLEKYGVYKALVFGRIRRFCEMQEGVCKASQQSIAEWLGMKRWTVYRAIITLKEDGYIIDKTPNRRFRPHIYEVTSKLEDENEAWLVARRIAKAEKYEAEKRGEKFAGDTGIGVAKNPIEAVPTHKTEAPCGPEPHGVELRTPRSVAKNPMECSLEPLKESIKDTTEETFLEREPTTLSEKTATNKPFVDIPAGSSLDESNNIEIPSDDISAVSVSSRDSANVNISKNDVPAEIEAQMWSVLSRIGVEEEDINPAEYNTLCKYAEKYAENNIFQIVSLEIIKHFRIRSIKDLLSWFETKKGQVENLAIKHREQIEATSISQ
jgi:hypothetical protein